MNQRLKLTIVQKKLKITKEDVIKYQLVTELILMRNLDIIKSDLELLCSISKYDSIELSKFCFILASEIISKTKSNNITTCSQNIRNRITKLIKRGIIVKTGVKNNIMINPEYNIINKSNTLLDFKFVNIESSK